uniref:C2H2-type domain-containing protein n=1 Tax=Plectus sambesii TaxID=2011161 RepID=A0A914X9W9_9BILA
RVDDSIESGYETNLKSLAPNLTEATTMPVTRGKRGTQFEEEPEQNVAAQSATRQTRSKGSESPSKAAEPLAKRVRTAPMRLEDEQYEQSVKRARRGRGADSIGSDDGQVDVVDDGASSPRRSTRRPRPTAADDQFIEESVEARMDAGDGQQQPATLHAEEDADHQEDDDDNDGPPKLVAEDGPPAEEILMAEMMERQQMLEEQGYYDGQLIQVQSPGGTQQLIQYQLAPGQEGQGIPEGAVFVDDGQQFDEHSPADLRTVEFNFLDNKNICCGLCGEIVPYEHLMSDHLPNNHPEVLGEGDMHMEEIPYEEWLREKLRAEKRAIESGFKLTAYESPARVHRSANRLHRRVSQIRVNPLEMSLSQLDAALKKKMVEKMGRKVPVTLVDKQHARCGLCNAVVSLNKKFEVVHLVRHFNAWHPSAHRCAGTWATKTATRQGSKPLSMHDFAVIDSNNSTPDNLQCIWCGMFMDTDSLAMHFDEVHPDDIDVPKCNLCLQELVLNARMQEKFAEDFEITLPDEHHIRIGKFGATVNSEGALERCIERRLAKKADGGEGSQDDDDDDDEMDDMDAETEEVGPEAFLNSRMSLGKRKKPKRQFIMPALRQAAPIDSQYVEPVTECHWKCKLCQGDILAAVISAGAIRHYRTTHPEHLDSMQYELCKARLERVSDGCMEFVHPQLIECLLCNMTYNLHKPFNMCRAIRHLKSKHPNLMPEYAGVSQAQGQGQEQPTSGRQALEHRQNAAKPVAQTPNANSKIQTRSKTRGSGAQISDTTDPATLEMLKQQFGVDIDKVQAVTGADGEQMYVLMPDGEEMDAATAEQLAVALASGEGLQMEEGVGDEAQEEEEDEEGNDGGNRVFTLSVGKGGDGAKAAAIQQVPPMPEPLTEHDGE